MSWLLQSRDAWPQMRPRWQALGASDYSDHPFLDVRFVDAALAYFGDDNVQLATYQGAGNAYAVIRRRNRFFVDTFCPSQLPMALLMYDDAARADHCLASLVSASGAQMLSVLHHDEMYQSPVSVGTGVLEKIDYALTMNVDARGSFDDYWSGRSKNLRRNISRYLNRAARDGLEVSLDEVRDTARMGDAVGAYGDIESAGWKGDNGSAIHRDNEQGRFYTQVLEAFAERGGARVYHLRMNDDIVASRLLVTGGGTAVILKTTYDESFARLAPGRLLLYMVLNSLFESQDIDYVEFYTKANADQLQWSSSSRMIHHYNLYRNPLLAKLGRVARRVGRAKS